MAPIYKFHRARLTEAWYQLSQAEQDAHTAKVTEARQQVGGKVILQCTPVWSNEKFMTCGVEEFPSVEAEQSYTMLLHQLQHFRYYKGESMLAIKWPPE